MQVLQISYGDRTTIVDSLVTSGRRKRSGLSHALPDSTVLREDLTSSEESEEINSDPKCLVLTDCSCSFVDSRSNLRRKTVIPKMGRKAWKLRKGSRLEKGSILMF